MDLKLTNPNPASVSGTWDAVNPTLAEMHAEADAMEDYLHSGVSYPRINSWA